MFRNLKRRINRFFYRMYLKTHTGEFVYACDSVMAGVIYDHLKIYFDAKPGHQLWENGEIEDKLLRTFEHLSYLGEGDEESQRLWEMYLAEEDEEKAAELSKQCYERIEYLNAYAKEGLEVFARYFVNFWD